MFRLFVILIVSLLPHYSMAIDKTQMQLRTCFASEMAYVIKEYSDPSKSYEENEAIGKKVGYVIVEYYQDAIWSMSDPESAALDMVGYASESAPERAQHMTSEALLRDIQRCRNLFSR